MAKKKLPVYRMVIEESPESEYEVNYVSLVEFPAIQKDFQAFNEARPFKFEVNEEKRIVTGPAMLADVPIYRRKGDEEFFVVFDKETITIIAQKFFQKGYQRNINLMHAQGADVDGAFMFESWIVDKERGVKPMKGYEDAKEGSWFVSMKINNDEVWQKIKEGEFKGFSVEGFFQMELLNEEVELMKQLKQIAGNEYEDLVKEIQKALS